MADLRARVEALGGRIADSTGGTPTVTVTTDLPAILDRTEQSLLVSRAGVLVLTIQLVILAVYAVLLSAALLVEHRRVDTTMLRSRGAGPRLIATMAAGEGVVLVLVAVLVGPWLALGALKLFDLVGPLADIGLRLDPAVGPDAYIAAAAAGLLCLIALVLPAFLSARSLAGVQGGMARGQTRSVGQRLGLDIALLVVAAIGLFQLRQYGGPLTASVKGTVGVDPLLIATPAIGLLAGAIVALRLIPLAARALERGTLRGRGLVPSLSARQVARRPLRYTRAALLLTLAMSMGVFAVSYAATWTTSQDDQARYQVGADIRVTPSRRTRRASCRRARAGVRRDRRRHGIEPGRPAERGAPDRRRGPDRDRRRGRPGRGHDAARSGRGTPGRPVRAAGRRPGDDRSRPASRRTDRPAHPGRPRHPGTGQPEVPDDPLDPAEVAQWPGITVSAVVRDARGVLHRFAAPTTTLGDAAAGRHRARARPRRGR